MSTARPGNKGHALRASKVRQERKQTLEALSDSEACLHQAQTMAQLAHAITGPDGQFESTSKTLPSLIGVAEAQVPTSARQWLQLVHSDDRENFRRASIDASIGSARAELEYRLLRGDGEWIRIRHVMEPLLTPGETGGEGRWFNTIQDVTAYRGAEDALRESELRYRRLFEAAKDGIMILDFESGRIVDVNPCLIELLGMNRQDFLGKRLWDVGLWKDVEAGKAAFRELRAQDYLRYESLPLAGRDGRCIDAEFISNVYVVDGARVIQCNVRDMTERKHAQERITRLNRVYAVLSRINALGVRARSKDELFAEACRIAVEEGNFGIAWIGALDTSTQDITPVAWAGIDAALFAGGKRSVKYTSPQADGCASRSLRERKAVFCNDIQSESHIGGAGRTYAIARGYGSLISLPLLVDGEPVGNFSLFAREKNFFDEDELKLLDALASDISGALAHLETGEKLKYLAYYDALTGLANRSLFLERATQYIQSAASGKQKLAFYLIDLAGFKNINDTLGQSGGDSLLKQVALWLTVDAGDANLVARVGADQFAVVLPRVRHEEDVVRLLEKSLGAFLEHPFQLGDVPFRLAAKTGVALFPDDGDSADSLFRNAEAALKKAKASGDRYLFFTQKMTEMMAGRVTLENQLRYALDNEEFVLHYQPKVSLVSGEVTSAEALIRWNDPRTGLVPPGRFIPILEETGMIHDVGRWALHKAIEDYLRWRRTGLRAVRIAVNVSSLQLRSRGFIAEVRQALDSHEHTAGGLELEITESVMMEDVEHNIASLQAIRDLGVTIAIDDFGTGFSSLGYLSKLPADVLKIDRSFIVGMAAGPEGLSLVSTIISLAHALKLKVVAEGVETDEQSRFLRLLGCEEMQGFLFSRPLAVDVFERNYLTKASGALVD